MAPEVTVEYTDEDRRLIEAVAERRGMTFEEAANALLHEGIARRVRRKWKRGPSAHVKNFRKVKK